MAIHATTPGRQRVSASTVIAHYLKLSPGGDKDIDGLFAKVNVWHDIVFTGPAAGRAQFFYSPELPRDHPDHLLTSYGRKTNLMEVARAYLELREGGGLPEHPYMRNIRYFIEQFHSGVPLPHVLLVTGRMRRKVYIIDGNTRSLAAAVHGIEMGGRFPYLRAYIGRPALLSPFIVTPDQVRWAVHLLTHESSAT